VRRRPSVFLICLHLCLEALEILDVDLCAHHQPCLLLLAERSDDLGWRAHDQRAIGYFLAFSNQGIGPDQAVIADFCSIQND
jgi:hypothetical protein